MVYLHYSHVIVWLIAVDVALSNIPQLAVTNVNNHLRLKLENDNRTQSSTNLTKVKTRRKGKASIHRSTSSSSRGAAKESDSDTGESLSGSLSASSRSEDTKKKRDQPKSTVERHGWRKWHRKCQKCPEDMAKKWRDPSISWICGAYQRARRSFKSLCMMHYRNCQDGTMFVKISNYRCQNDTGREEKPRGDHFFYEYKARLSGESDKTNDEISSSSLQDSYSNY